ncbi:secretion/conjugation apparatus DotM-related subunit [Pseudomonas sp. NMI4491_12]|uniref:secretion/conjugation apparatus DotM-related subunit n=1 Tax=Pseudomonas sp. NMI4491_12 TaxID=2903146 RepID=UPI001E2C296E|nr:type IV secretion protein [Pseudomonas sp. NMI4491_12]MCE0968436.1 type IV secretion protein [Pseudomonas sp. NMI4491_12]
MKQQGGGQKSFTWDDPAILIGIIVVLYLGGWGAWYFAHEKISAAYTYIRYVELWLPSVLGDFADIPGISSINEWVGRMCAPDGIVGACQRDFSNVAWGEITTSSLFMNGFLLVLMVVLSVRMFLRINKTHPKLRFTRTHNIKSYVQENKAQYPHLRMFAELDLIAQPLDHPVFGMSQTSRQFAYEHLLISGWQAQSDRSWAPTLDREKATEVMRRQLGQHWTRVGSLSAAETLLVAIALPRVVATDTSLDDEAFKAAMADSDYMVAWCWDQFKAPSAKGGKGAGAADPYAWLKPEVPLEVPRAIIQKYIKHPNASAILHAHAFVRTIIFAMFFQARRLGVLPPAEMRWLRFFDRDMWYALQTIGRQAGFPEAPGILSHFLYECKAGASLAEPQLDKAVNGLEQAMSAYKYTDADKKRYEAVQEEKEAAARKAVHDEKMT